MCHAGEFSTSRHSDRLRGNNLGRGTGGIGALVTFRLPSWSSNTRSLGRGG